MWLTCIIINEILSEENIFSSNLNNKTHELGQ